MDRKEVIFMIKRNNHTKCKAIIFISDFLDISRAEAEKIYEEEFENV